MIQPILAQFHPPTTKDFVWPCWGGSLEIGGFSFCMNFIYFLLLLSFLAFILLFYLAFRRPQLVPGKLQTVMESGVQFVRENIAAPMLGQEGDRFMPLLVTLSSSSFWGTSWRSFPGSTSPRTAASRSRSPWRSSRG